MKPFYKLLPCLLILGLGIINFSASYGQCTNTYNYESATIDAAKGTLVQISSCNYSGDYSTVNGAVAGQVLTFSTESDLGIPQGDFITIHGGAPDGPVISRGTSPLNFTDSFDGTLFADWNADNTCTTDANCRQTFVQLIVTPPGNDDICNATVLSCDGAISGTTIGATFTGDDGLGGFGNQVNGSMLQITSAGVWHTFSAAVGTQVTLATCDGTDGNSDYFDTQIHLYTSSDGTCQGTLTLVAENDDGLNCGYHSSLTFIVPPGQSAPYFIYINGFESGFHSVGNYTLTATCTCPAPEITACDLDIPVANSCGGNVTYSSASATNGATITYSPASGSFFNLGTTTVTATATNLCGSASCQFNVTVTAPALSANATSPQYNGYNIHCNGGTDGSASVTASGGCGDYHYNWSSGETTSSISGKGAGTYNVTVTDDNGGSSSTSVTLNAPDALANTFTSSTRACGYNISCSGGSDGSISTSVTGGTLPYAYTWSNGSTSSSVSGLSAGTYAVTITDANGCVKSCSRTLTAPAALSSTLTSSTYTASCGTNVSCSGATDGSISSAVTGGCSPYNYTWSNGAHTSSISGLAAGTYNVAITDQNGCVSNASSTLTAPPALSNPVISGGASPTMGSVLKGGTYTFHASSPDCNATFVWTYTSSTNFCYCNIPHVHCNHLGPNGTCNLHHEHCNHDGPNGNCNRRTHDHCNNAGPNGSCNLDHTHCHCYRNHTHSNNGVTVTLSGDSTADVTIAFGCQAPNGTLSVTATDACGSRTSTLAITTNAGSIVYIYTALLTTGSGCHPTTTKSAIAPIATPDSKLGFKVWRSHNVGIPTYRSNFDNIWHESCAGVPTHGHINCSYNPSSNVTNQVTVTGPVLSTYGGGPAYKYTMVVPAGYSYLIIAKEAADANSCDPFDQIPNNQQAQCYVYPGKRTVNTHGHYDQGDEDDDDDCYNGYDNDSHFTSCFAKSIFLQVIQDASGKTRPANTDAIPGSMLLIASPNTVDFTDSTALLPIVYESVDGFWEQSVTADPPEGFFAIPGSAVDADVSTDNMNTVQFTLVDTGSVWSQTQVTTKLKHNGKEITHTVAPGMVNHRVFNVMAQNYPNPFSGKTTIEFNVPKDGHAKLDVYNPMGQKISTLFDDFAKAGTYYKVDFDSKDMGQGIYFYNIQAKGVNMSKKMQVIK